MATQPIRVQGLRELQRAFALAEVGVNRKLKESLRDVAEPVRAQAESLAVSQIPRIGLAWSRMRVGVTARGVYVAPKERSKRGRNRRPNLAPLLLGRAMEPALESNRGEVVDAFDDLLTDVANLWERA